MEYDVNKLSTFVKFKRLEVPLTQKEFSEKIFVSRSLINNIENGLLGKLDQHLHNIFNCFNLDLSCYTDDDQQYIEKMNNVIHQTIYYELPTSIEKIIDQFYFKGIENTYLYLYYQLVKTCMFARQYINDDWLEKYFPIFDSVILQFDDSIQQYYQIMKYAYYKERRLFDLCNEIEKNLNFETMSDDMKGLCYHIIASRHMYDGETFLELQYMSWSKKCCRRVNNQRRLIALINVECDISEKSGNLKIVIDLFKKALAKMDEIHFEGLRSIFLSNLGIAYTRAGHFKEAVGYLELSYKQNNDNLDLFYLIYSYIKLKDKKNGLNLLKDQYKVKCFDEVFYELLEWCKQSLKRPYTKKCGKMLDKIYKRYYHKVSVNTRKLILELLADQYENQGNYVLACYYQNELIEIMRGGNV